MLSISVKNLRSLFIEEQIEIKPITVLLGENSAGKSSFLRIFPLFKQSFENKTSSSLSWFGDYVDFGSFKIAIANKDLDKDMTFKFSFEIPENLGLESDFMYRMENTTKLSKKMIEMMVEFTYNKDILKYLKVNIGDINLNLHLDDSSMVKKVILNNSLIDLALTKKFAISSIVPDFSRVYDDSMSNSSFGHYSEIANRYFSSDNVPERRDRYIISERTLWLLSVPIFKYDLFNKYLMDNARYKKLLKKDANITQLYVDLIVYQIPNILKLVNRVASNHFRNVEYIKPLRENADRYYRVKSSNVISLDSSGKNLPEFILSLNPKDEDDFRQWTLYNFQLVIESKKDEGSLAQILITDGNETYNIADLGHGFNQILPLLVLLWDIERQARIRSTLVKQMYDNETYLRVISPFTIAIEQPEVHLHPRFQAKFAQLVSRIIKKTQGSNPKINFIIETHSETFINQLIKEVEIHKSINFSDLNILFFDKTNNKTRIKKLNIVNNKIMNWPIGFFTPEI